MGYKSLWIVFGGVWLVFFILEVIKGVDGTLLVSLSYLSAITQGAIAIVAIAETVRGGWIKPVKEYLLALWPAVIFSVSLFFIFIFQLDIYPWSDNQGLWLNKGFYVLRNLFLYEAICLAAWKYATESLKESDKKYFWAVIYLFAFVAFQANIGYDWFMPLDYPWYSSLFDAYITLEAVYSALALIAIIRLIMYLKSKGNLPEVFKKTQWDTSTIMFGFSFLWGYFLYSQVLIIWYGNLYEEFHYFLKRLEHFPVATYAIPILLLLIPWISLLFRKVKLTPYFMAILACVVLFGIYLERVVIVGSVAHVNIFVSIIEIALVWFVIYMTIRSRKREFASA